ncbi:hypothetical protein FA13DRAFT_1709302 [Coprinellus micaceus]|uniref:Uncharacterized protein n=1 Tax=Coprinellus micaceus TaxID=71717 RepID=A0A4Y7TE25_COPMI|nr:hypothetical protein FA13DRAFT_1709302 [Coprinellus micaceus]
MAMSHDHDLDNALHRKSLTKIVTSGHKMAVEIWQYAKVPVPREDRVCRYGCIGTVETPEHIWLECAGSLCVGAYVHGRGASGVAGSGRRQCGGDANVAVFQALPGGTWENSCIDRIGAGGWTFCPPLVRGGVAEQSQPVSPTKVPTQQRFLRVFLASAGLGVGASNGANLRNSHTHTHTIYTRAFPIRKVS